MDPRFHAIQPWVIQLRSMIFDINREIFEMGKLALPETNSLHLPIENGDILIENGDIPIENGDIPIENGLVEN